MVVVEDEELDMPPEMCDEDPWAEPAEPDIEAEPPEMEVEEPDMEAEPPDMEAEDEEPSTWARARTLCMTSGLLKTS